MVIFKKIGPKFREITIFFSFSVTEESLDDLDLKTGMVPISSEFVSLCHQKIKFERQPSGMTINGYFPEEHFKYEFTNKQNVYSDGINNVRSSIRYKHVFRVPAIFGF